MPNEPHVSFWPAFREAYASIEHPGTDVQSYSAKAITAKNKRALHTQVLGSARRNGRHPVGGFHCHEKDYCLSVSNA